MYKFLDSQGSYRFVRPQLNILLIKLYDDNKNLINAKKGLILFRLINTYKYKGWESNIPSLRQKLKLWKKYFFLENKGNKLIM